MSDWINDWVGVEYEQNGRGPRYDCYGLVKEIYSDLLGIDLPEWDVPFYSQKNKVIEIENRINESLNKDFADEVAEPEDFDFVMVYRNTHCHHIGLIYNGGVLHINQSTIGAQYDRLSDFKAVFGEVKYFRWLK